MNGRVPFLVHCLINKEIHEIMSLKFDVYPKVIIAAPTSSHKDYCLKEWSKQLKSFTYPNKQVLVLDNSPNKKHLRVLKQYINGKVEYMRKGENIRQIICNCQNYIREYVLNSDAEYLLFIESDIFVDDNPDIIEHLVARSMAWGTPVVGIPYFTFHGDNTRYLAMHLEDLHVGAAKSQIMTPDWSFDFHDGGFKQAYQFGFGFLLIHRSVLKAIPFRLEKEGDNLKAHSDSYWHEDIYLAGIPAYLDTNFIARHENSDWGEISKKERIE